MYVLTVITKNHQLLVRRIRHLHHLVSITHLSVHAIYMALIIIRDSQTNKTSSIFTICLENKLVQLISTSLFNLCSFKTLIVHVILKTHLDYVFE